MAGSPTAVVKGFFEQARAFNDCEFKHIGQYPILRCEASEISEYIDMPGVVICDNKNKPSRSELLEARIVIVDNPAGLSPVYTTPCFRVFVERPDCRTPRVEVNNTTVG